MSQKNLSDRAHKVLPAGGLGNFDPEIFIREGKGARVWDEDGNEYIDYLMGSGPMLLGHGHPEVVEAVQEQLGAGMTFFANNARSLELAEEICRAVRCAERVRYFCSGGEADMYAMRLARAYTGRDKIMKFEGGYHGMSAEAQMSLAPKKMVNFPIAVPDSAGIPESVRDEMLIAPYNDIEFASSLISEHANDIAGIIVEPMQRTISPAPGFLESLREECSKHGIVLIFDEVVTGFRVAYGGAQELYGVTPDVCTIGKVIGGGFPLAAIAGTAELMMHFDANKVDEDQYLMHRGTLSGNPVAAVAGLKTMEILRRDGTYDRLRGLGNTLMQAHTEHLSAAGYAHQISGDPTLFGVVFTNTQVKNYRDVLQSDNVKTAAFNKLLRQKGILKSPGKLYLSLALTEDDIEQTIDAISYAAKYFMDG